MNYLSSFLHALPSLKVCYHATMSVLAITGGLCVTKRNNANPRWRTTFWLSAALENVAPCLPDSSKWKINGYFGSLISLYACLSALSCILGAGRCGGSALAMGNGLSSPSLATDFRHKMVQHDPPIGQSGIAMLVLLV